MCFYLCFFILGMGGGMVYLKIRVSKSVFISSDYNQVQLCLYVRINVLYFFFYNKFTGTRFRPLR